MNIYFISFHRPVGIVGAVVSGITSAIWWTAQGVCFESSCVNISRAKHDANYNGNGSSDKYIDIKQDDEDVNENEKDLKHEVGDDNITNSDKDKDMNRIRANLSTEWTYIYQGADVLVFLSCGLIPLYAGVSIPALVAGLTIFGVITSLAGNTIDSLGIIATSYYYTIPVLVYVLYIYIYIYICTILHTVILI